MNTKLLEQISAENLNVYRASPIRLREDVSQEAQIANDYRGRLVYEMLQNADDAMNVQASSDRVVFHLTDTDLWVGNSGRPLDEADVKGLCGIGASSKGEVAARRRASIGHKGMGFKSVLEITAAPEVVSDDYAFRMAADFARGPIDRLMAELGQAKPTRVPIMRFPSSLEEVPMLWHELRKAEIRTLFRFPLRQELTGEQRSLLADRLLALPVTTIVFLKHLERVDVRVETKLRSEGFSWTIRRECRTGDTWTPSSGLVRSGMYRIHISSGSGEMHDFLLAHDADVEINEHRGGLNSYAWEGVEVCEVSVAALLKGDTPAPLPLAWRQFHVFLPTTEPCPYPLLVNGAFLSDLSRQEVRVGDERTDYNRYLMQRVAALFRDGLAAELQREGRSAMDILLLLDRGVDVPGAAAPTAAGRALYEAMRDELATHPFLSREDGRRLSLKQCVVPPLVGAGLVGERFRQLISGDAEYKSHFFPEAQVCQAAAARVLVDHGALELSPTDAASVLGTADLKSVKLEDHESGGLFVDPVLRILEGLWEGFNSTKRDELALAVRRQPLFPIGVEKGVVQRAVTDGVACFYPPRKLGGSVPLEGLSFLMRELCWGALLPSERSQILKGQLVAWQALFELREFKFPDVMRASVLPALELDPDKDAERRLNSLRELTALAAICQLSGRAPDPARSLRYERLGSNRALFNLSRLPVPCRASDGAKFYWRPAYQVYFGEDWTGEASVDTLLTTLRKQGADTPDIPILAGPEIFDGLLARFRHLEEAAESDDDEVGLEEDEEAPPDQADRDRWVDFLTWIGVNRVLRPVHFHDVEDRGTGWLTTKDLARPDGWAFRALPASLWDAYRQGAIAAAADKVRARTAVPYLYRVHDLEHIVPLLKSAAVDATGEIAKALFLHLAHNWSHLERFTKAEAAIVPADRVPSMRTKPPRAHEDEVEEIGDDLWVLRLRSHDWCPTTHGPRRPERAWLRTAEVQRQFGRQSSDAGVLLPLLDIDQQVAPTKTRSLAQTLGIRVELTPSSFTPEDAKGVLARLQALYREAALAERLTDRDLRLIRPAYRTLMELLPGSETTTSPAFGAAILAGSPLLVHDGRWHYRFDPSDHVLYADRPGTRERLGTPPDLWTFVLEADRAARAPLISLLKVRVLEDELTWSPQPSDASFEEDEIAKFRAGVTSLAPYILARLGAERREDRLVAQDGRRLREFAKAVEPVTELSVRCRLGSRELGATLPRNAFVNLQPSGTLAAFVVWGTTPWPPTTVEDAEALATALSDLLEVGHFEAFLALINARSHESRLKLLRLAGATTDLTAARSALNDDGGAPIGSQESATVEPQKTAGESLSEVAARNPTEPDNSVPSKTPLFQPEDLLVDGIPVAITGDGSPPRSSGSRRDIPSKDGEGPAGRYGGRTDLNELDRLGMCVALAFELNRVRRGGSNDAQVFDPSIEQNQPHALVFDVSTLSAIESARVSSQSFREAFAVLSKNGFSERAPGFDILTLDPRRPTNLDRLIELKSSGLNARVQDMSWNEWKSARNSELRKFFYLYLVGNLRSDLGDAMPFIRAVHDPFATIWAQEIQQDATSRKIQLNLSHFKTAEQLELQVRRTTSGPS